jgi:hypothetical protein
LAVVGALIVAGGAVAAFMVTKSSGSSPTSAVSGYVTALQDENYQVAASFVDPADRPSGAASNVFLSALGDAVLAGGIGRVTRADVIGHSVEGNHAWVDVRAELNGESSTSAVPCELVDGRWYVYLGDAQWASEAPASNVTTTSTSTSVTRNTANGTSTKRSTSPRRSTTATEPSEQQGAAALAALLSQSVEDRSAVDAASQDVSACDPNLTQDVQTFDDAASSRQSLITQLSALPDASSLPSTMIQALSGAWQASMQADEDFAAWAEDEASGTCTPNDTADPNYQAATGPDQQATTDKQAFVSLWNPIAQQYGLTTYTWNQL